MFLFSFFTVFSVSVSKDVVKIGGYDVTCIFEEKSVMPFVNGKFQIGDGEKSAIKMTVDPNSKPHEYTSIFTIPERIKYKGKVYILTKIAQFGLANTNFTSITFDFGTEYSNAYSLILEPSAFKNSTFLKEVNLGFTGNKELPSRCFYNCTSLETVTFSSRLQSIKEYAFSKCKSLETIDLSKINNFVINVGTFAESVIKEIKFGNSLYEICDFAFCNAHIGKFVMPNVSSIGIRAFYNFTGLKELTFNEGLKKIGNFSFYMSDVTSVQCPVSLENLEKSAFGECKSLEFVNMSLCKLESIPKYAFCGTPALKIFYLPYNISFVDDMAFIEAYIKELYYFGTKNLLFAFNVKSLPIVYVAKHYKRNFFSRVKVTKIDKPSYIPDIEQESDDLSDVPDNDGGIGEMMSSYQTFQDNNNNNNISTIIFFITCFCIFIAYLLYKFRKNGCNKMLY